MEPTLKQERALDAVEDAIQAFRDRFGGGDVFRCYGCGRTAGSNDWTLEPDPAMKGAADRLVCPCGNHDDVGELTRTDILADLGAFQDAPEPDWDALNDQRRFDEGRDL